MSDQFVESEPLPNEMLATINAAGEGSRDAIRTRYTGVQILWKLKFGCKFTADAGTYVFTEHESGDGAGSVVVFFLLSEVSTLIEGAQVNDYLWVNGATRLFGKGDVRLDSDPLIVLVEK